MKVEGEALNKYMGFYELNFINIPSVRWKSFTPETELERDLLWTVRVAMEEGGDLNLPRAVGVMADEALQKAREFFEIYSGKGMVIYYPYFIAEKSGVLDINSDRSIIEAVEKDLWNLVTYGRKNITAIFPCGGAKPRYIGDMNFLGGDEIDELMRNAAIIRGRYRDEVSEGRSILAEWSFAYNTDIGNRPIGPKRLIFYELRGV